MRGCTQAATSLSLSAISGGVSSADPPIASGLRVFDITKLRAPREIAYFVTPTRPRAENGYQASNFAMSQPAFAARRREIWFSDGATGFYVVRVYKRVWPSGPRRG